MIHPFIITPFILLYSFVFGLFFLFLYLLFGGKNESACLFFFYFSFLLFLSSFISFFKTGIRNAVQIQYCFSIPGGGTTGGASL